MEVESSKNAIKIGLEEFTLLSKELFDSLATIEEGRSQYRETFREPALIMRELIKVDQKLQEDVAKCMTLLNVFCFLIVSEGRTNFFQQDFGNQTEVKGKRR